MFQLLLIRHAQSANNALPESQRVPDPGLTSLGQRQAESLAGWLEQHPPTELWTSGFRRALETTRPIAEKLGMRPRVRWELFEQGGCYSGYLPGNKKAAVGMGRSEIVREFGDWEIDSRISDHGWYHGCEWENDDAARDRAAGVARWIQEEMIPRSEENQTLVRPALIIHADFKALLLESLLDAFDPSLLGDDRYRILEFANTSITQLTWLKPGWRIDSYNATPHITRVASG